MRRRRFTLDIVDTSSKDHRIRELNEHTRDAVPLLHCFRSACHEILDHRNSERRATDKRRLVSTISERNIQNMHRIVAS